MLENSWATRVEESQRRRKVGPVIFSHISKTRSMVKHISKHVDLHASLSHWLCALLSLIGAGDTQGIFKLCHIADLKAKAFEARTARVRKENWQKVVGCSASSGVGKLPTRFAFQWIKGPAGWAKSPMGSIQDEQVQHSIVDDLPDGSSLEIHAQSGHNNVVPLNDQATVEEEANLWAKRWDEGKEYEVSFPNDLPVPSELVAQELSWAASTFPAHTGVGQDNASPRAYNRLTFRALSALARLLLLFEAMENWPAVLSLVLVVLIPKSDGGKRPIGLFPSPIRLWWRVRSNVARKWEAAQARPSLFGSAGMGALRAAWNVSFAAEAAATSNRTYGQGLLDLIKAFERIPHHLLVKAARKHGYCLVMLRLSLAAYRCSRTLVDNKVCSRLIVAICGITAGSGSATTELRCLVLDVVDAAYVLFPSISLVVFVDDFTIEFCGTFFKVRHDLAKAIDFIVTHFETILLLQISAAKSIVIGGTTMLAKAVVAAASTKKVSAARHGKLLGTPSGGGRRRVVKHLYDRMRNFKGKVGRIHALRRMGIRTGSVARAAGTPAITYGVETIGMSDSHLSQVRSLIARASSPEGGGKDLNLVLYLLDGVSGSLDPAFDAHVLPIVRYATAWWEGWQKASAISAAMTDAQRKLASRGFKWGCVCGPMAALIMTLRRVAWVIVSPTILSDDVGNVFNLLVDPPAVLAEAMKGSVRRWRIAQILHKYPACKPEAPDYVDPRLDE